MRTTLSLDALETVAGIMLAAGENSFVLANKILKLPIHRRAAAIKRVKAIKARRAAKREASETPSEIRSESFVFPKPAKRVSHAATDHRLRLSSGSSDSKAMKAFLANGGDITVLPTRNAKGFSQSRRVKVSGGSGLSSAEKASRTHSKVLREARAHR